MGKLIIDGNKVYTVDEDCMKRKNLAMPQMNQREMEEAAKQMREKRRRSDRM